MFIIIVLKEDRTWLVETVLFTNCRTSVLPRCMTKRFINKRLFYDKSLNVTNKIENKKYHTVETVPKLSR
jgi:hypothetical protein